MSRYCFVAIPFRPELNFFFLYLKYHLEKNFGLIVERGDAQILTKPLMDKIRDQILHADLVIGDVTGGNPNVFYELGIAQASGKPILFITQDIPDKTPVDIRQFEFIQYDLCKEQDFLSKIDNAIRNAFGGSYQDLFDKARVYLQRFNADKGLNCQPKSFQEFQALVMRGEQTSGGIPTDKQEDLLVQFLLPKILDDFTNPTIFQQYNKWINDNF
jgi:hypothetical protein